ncbi:M23 family metallopeptidase [Nocardioides ungokensis]|uniref:M23 family metallopeptidase n=1 Tax=Nocardioides ungokensis TaxID=1643322 RepID=UPI0015E05197|nr:M23 family metallopeptidase [Nocardioides ungokensis]
MVLGVVVILSPGDSASGMPACIPAATTTALDVHLDRQQLSVAATVIAVGKQHDVPPRGWVVALAAGMQESGLRPLPYGDRDSVGVFQQRTSWGPLSERLAPRSAAVMFFTGGHAGQPGLLDIDGWAAMPVTEAAQAVQVSAYPDAYAKWEPVATRLVAQLSHLDARCDAAADGSGGSWTFPLGDAPYVDTAGFGDCGAHWADCHTGQDFAAPIGTPVMAAGDGVVTFAGWAGPYGNAIHVLHSGGTATWYAHLSRIDIRPGQRVHAGQLIGLVGDTGNTTGPHLHFEVRTGASHSSDGTPIDPLPWLHSHGIK